MVCKEKNAWCAYWIGDRCRADEMWSAHYCVEPHPVPLWCDSWKVIKLVDMKELRAQVDVADMIIKEAQPNDVMNVIDVAECKQAKEDCQEFLDIVSRFNDGTFKKGDDIFGEGEPSAPEGLGLGVADNADLKSRNVGETLISPSVSGGEWV